MRQRSGIILIENDKLALIERHRAGLHYFAFPGGGVDEGETIEQAAVREAEEELGIQVKVIQKVAEVIFNGKPQYYFLVKHLSGDFGTGTGEEYGEYNPIHGTYHPLWMPVAEIPAHNVVPRELADLVVRCSKKGWPTEPVIIIEEKR
ncbi:MAG: NUDIX domain-containing protein [Anaerolineales bacterium]|nr:NUDIX domain-containing protein [Anaerolineales bacterium]